MKKIDSPHANLSTLPANFATMHPDLEIAFFSNNPFTEIPPVLSKCTKLRILGFKNCLIENFAEDSLPESLEWLILSGNQIRELPRSIGRLTKLRKLALSGNKISALPIELNNCKELELLRISANSINNPPPEWLFTMPKLSWCAFAGNSFYKDHIANEAISAVDAIAWDQILLGEQIGESPSSKVFRAQLNASHSSKEIAVKEFQGALTSDGWPLDDLRCSLLAGLHPNIIGTLGRITDHPLGKNALALELLDNKYKQVGRPPDFASCTRDTFPAGTVFSETYIINVLASVAAAMEHIHSRNLTHGDIYAHNLLATSTGFAKLGDFGAASYLPADLFPQSVKALAQRVEVRAFGCLVDDLLQQIDKREATPTIVNKLLDLKVWCCRATVAERPSFAEIRALLAL